VPEQHGKQARHAEHEGKVEKIPLLAEKIYVGIAKELHQFDPLLKSYDFVNDLVIG
jgi:hypothetical protein